MEGIPDQYLDGILRDNCVVKLKYQMAELKGGGINTLLRFFY
jgi:hypothetical protein